MLPTNSLCCAMQLNMLRAAYSAVVASVQAVVEVVRALVGPIVRMTVNQLVLHSMPTLLNNAVAH